MAGQKEQEKGLPDQKQCCYQGDEADDETLHEY